MLEDDLLCWALSAGPQISACVHLHRCAGSAGGLDSDRPGVRGYWDQDREHHQGRPHRAHGRGPGHVLSGVPHASAHQHQANADTYLVRAPVQALGQSCAVSMHDGDAHKNVPLKPAAQL